MTDDTPLTRSTGKGVGKDGDITVEAVAWLDGTYTLTRTDDTPRDPLPRCKWCAAVIEKRGRVWFHLVSGIPYCTDLMGMGHTAKPAGRRHA